MKAKRLNTLWFNLLSLQASGTFKFPDLFPKDEEKDEKSAEEDSATETTASIRWF